MILFVDTVTRSSSPCFELGSGKKYRTYFFLAFSPVFTTDSEKLVGRGEFYVVERNIILRSYFSIWKFCHFD